MLMTHTLKAQETFTSRFDVWRAFLHFFLVQITCTVAPNRTRLYTRRVYSQPHFFDGQGIF